MKQKNIFSLLFLSLSATSFGQWLTINTDNEPITVLCNGKSLTQLQKTDDTTSFDNWFENLNLDCPEVNFLDKKELISAYETTQVGAYLFSPTLSKASLESIESNFLFRNYENKLALSINSIKYNSNIKLEATDATIKSEIVNNEIRFSVNPKGDKCNLTLLTKDINGKEIVIKTWSYKVLSFPPPFVENKTISKKDITQITIVPSALAPNNSYTVERIDIPSLNVVIIDDNAIFGKTVSKLKKNSELPIIVTCMEIESGRSILIAHSLKVVD
jgi:hypothetical protein